MGQHSSLQGEAEGAKDTLLTQAGSGLRVRVQVWGAGQWYMG